MWAEPRPFKDCVRFNLGFADDIDQRIIKGKRTRASMQLHSWFLRVFVEVHSWSHDCQTASGSSDLDQIQPRKCVFSRSGVRIVMSPGDVLVMFPTCFEGTLSLRKASVVVIPMASFIVSSFGDVHKRCMKVLPLSLVFFFFLVSASTSGMSSRNICTGTCPPVTRKSSSAARSPPLLMIRSVLPGAGGGGHRV